MAGDDRITIDADTVAWMVARQFPQWAELPVRPVAQSGWDNHTFHLGSAMKIRLPSAQRYVAQVDKENRFLPVLAPQLPLPIPAPLAIGHPDADFPGPGRLALGSPARRWRGIELNRPRVLPTIWRRS